MNTQTIAELSITIQRRVQWLAEEHDDHTKRGNPMLAQQCLGGIAALFELSKDLCLDGATLYAGTELNRCRNTIPFQVDISSECKLTNRRNFHD